MDGVAEIGFACVGENRALIFRCQCVLDAAGLGEGDFVNVACDKDVNVFAEAALQE